VNDISCSDRVCIVTDVPATSEEAGALVRKCSADAAPRTFMADVV
jgi:hypothetical protein